MARNVKLLHSESKEQQEKLRGEEGADGSQEGIQDYTDSLSEGHGLDSAADVNLYDGSQTVDDTPIVDATSFNKEIAFAGYDENNQAIYINIDQADMTNSGDVIKLAAHENARHQMNLDGTALRLSETDQRSLANNRGERAAAAWDAYANLGGFDTQSSTDRSTWTDNNRYASSVQNGTQSIREIRSQSLKPALYAFDGTGQDMNASQTDNNTNIGKLYDMYSGDNKFYQSGVGTNEVYGTNWLHAATGLGADERIGDMYDDLVHTYNGVDGDGKPLPAGSDEDIDIIGFSRGAASARDFANEINRLGIPDLSSARQVKVGSGQTARYVTVYDNYLVDPQTADTDIRFIGIYDTVGSFGQAGDSEEGHKNLTIPPNAQTIRHAISEDENRDGFPLTSVIDLGNPRDLRIKEQVFEGVHTDVGGGYQDDDSLSRDSLYWMTKEAQSVGVPFTNPLTKDLPVGKNGARTEHNELHGDKGWLYYNLQEYIGDGADAPRKVFYYENPAEYTPDIPERADYELNMPSHLNIMENIRPNSSEPLDYRKSSDYESNN